jgi:hypothetical protein
MWGQPSRLSSRAEFGGSAGGHGDPPIEGWNWRTLQPANYNAIP